MRVRVRVAHQLPWCSRQRLLQPAGLESYFVVMLPPIFLEYDFDKWPYSLHLQPKLFLPSIFVTEKKLKLIIELRYIKTSQLAEPVLTLSYFPTISLPSESNQSTFKLHALFLAYCIDRPPSH